MQKCNKAGEFPNLKSFVTKWKGSSGSARRKRNIKYQNFKIFQLFLMILRVMTNQQAQNRLLCVLLNQQLQSGPHCVMMRQLLPSEPLWLNFGIRRVMPLSNDQVTFIPKIFHFPIFSVRRANILAKSNLKFQFSEHFDNESDDEEMDDDSDADEDEEEDEEESDSFIEQDEEEEADRTWEFEED